MHENLQFKLWKIKPSLLCNCDLFYPLCILFISMHSELKSTRTGFPLKWRFVCFWKSPLGNNATKEPQSIHTNGFGPSAGELWSWDGCSELFWVEAGGPGPVLASGHITLNEGAALSQRHHLGLSWGNKCPSSEEAGIWVEPIASSPGILSGLFTAVSSVPSCPWHIIGTQEIFGEWMKDVEEQKPRFLDLGPGELNHNVGMGLEGNPGQVWSESSTYMLLVFWVFLKTPVTQ